MKLKIFNDCIVMKQKRLEAWNDNIEGGNSYCAGIEVLNVLYPTNYCQTRAWLFTPSWCKALLVNLSVTTKLSVCVFMSVFVVRAIGCWAWSDELYSPEDVSLSREQRKNVGSSKFLAEWLATQILSIWLHIAVEGHSSNQVFYKMVSVQECHKAKMFAWL